MANEEHIARLKQGVDAWNAWRRETPDARPDLRGAILRGAGQIPVYRETRGAGRALDDAVAAMRDGAAVAIYPEGTTTRNPDYSPMAAKNGVARLAALTGAPVVPVGQWGAHLLFTRGKLGPFRRGIRVVERAGPPIDLGLTPESTLTEINQAKDKVMEAIAGLVAEAREGWSPPSWYKGGAAGTGGKGEAAGRA